MSKNPINKKYHNEAISKSAKRLEHFTTYHDDGVTVKSVFHNTEDKLRDGILEEYHPDGTLFFSANVIDLKVSSRTKFYYKNGNIKCDIKYKDGIMHGLSKGYYFGGKLAMEVLWDMGIAVSGVYYNKNGYKSTMTQKQLDKKTINNQ